VKARVPKSLKKRLEAEAKRRGKTPSVLIRQALEEFLNNSNSKK
jgi:predicted DNA-binding protein